VWYLAISFPAFIFTHILLLSRAKQFTYFNLIGLVASVIFNLLLIPPLGIAGVAVSAVINISVLTLLCYRQVRVDLFRLDFKEILLLPLLASAAMVVLAFFSGGQTLLELSVYSALLYCALLYLIRGVNQADLQYLITIIKSRGVQDAR
jgi:O-antigen/teichoic acid export membrane protein